jgi:hypothetical protein
VTISTHLREFAGRPVRRYRPGLPWNPRRVAYRLVQEEGAPETQLRLQLEALARRGKDLRALVIGGCDELTNQRDESAPTPSTFLIDMREHFPALRALFIGDLVAEEYEISWIPQSDLGPLFEAYPDLEHLGARGGEGLRFQGVRAERLKTLIFETGGLPPWAISDVCQAHLPRLTHLELWLGTESYGGYSGVGDLAPILSGERFPALRYLGLRNSEYADDIARALLDAPIVDRLQVLDLSLGNLTDEGGELLLKNPRLAGLERLALYHHYLSPQLASRLKAMAGVAVVTEHELDRRIRYNEGARYCAVTE